MKKRVLVLCMVVISTLLLIACSKAEENVVEKREDVDIEATETTEDDMSENTVEEDRVYNVEEYGQLVHVREEFTDEESGELYYYYKIEEFFVNDTFSNAEAINNTLQQIYIERERAYKDTAESYQGDSYMDTPYDNFHFLSVELVNEDYISIWYNDVSYWGDIHPYSMFNGITIDCKTGKEVFASELLRMRDDEILTQVSSEMGLDVVATWEDIDFYLTESEIVFFYRMPNYWDDVVWERVDE